MERGAKKSPTSLLIALACIALPIHAVLADDGSHEHEIDKLRKLVAFPLHERATKWRCESSSKQMCSAKRCESTEPKTWIELDFENTIYSRCTTSGCNSYRMTVNTCGIFTSISGTDMDFAFKAVNDGSEFVDSIYAMTVAHLLFGSCQSLE